MAVVLVIASTTLSSPALAAPAAELQQTAASVLPRTAASEGSVRVGSARVSLDASSGAIPVGGAFGYTATVRAGRPLSYLQTRLRVFMPAGSLIYQKTFVEQKVPRGTKTFAFSRSIDDIGLDPGSYPIELSIRISEAGRTAEAKIPGKLLVYDPEGPKLPYGMIVRISAQPLADADGRFSSNPAQFTRARDDAVALAEYVLFNRSAKLTLALSPLMLEEWQRIASGYRVLGPEGDTEVPATDPSARAYGEALERVRQAARTGRLEVLSLGYSDPSLSELEGAGLLSDIGEQYTRGSSAVRTSLEVTPSAGSAPAGASLSEPAAKLMSARGMNFVVVRSAYTRSAKKPGAPGAYRSKRGKIRVLVSSESIAGTVTSGPSNATLAAAFEHMTWRKGAARLPILVEVGPRGVSAQSVIRADTVLNSQPWTVPSTASELVAGKKLPDLRLRAADPDADAPKDYWKTVAEARQWSKALRFSLAEGSPETVKASINSLIAEGSTWSGMDGGWLAAGRGLGYAAEALRMSQALLGDLSLSVKPITLAGATGNVPVTIVNSSERPLRVVLRVTPGSSVRIDGAGDEAITLSPGERFTEIPVELTNVLAGSMEVALFSQDVELASTTVTLRASYLDRLAIVGGILVLLGSLLVFIITRVRAAEPQGPSSTHVRRH